MIKVFDTTQDYETYSANGLKSGDLYYVKEDKSVHFKTNNIDGTDKNYNIGVGDDLVPTGNIALTENGSNIDIKQYATASVNVPIPEGYIVPTGSTTISENGEDIDIVQYATVTVNVPAPTPEYTALNLNTFTYMGDWYKFIKGIEAVKGKSIEVYNPNHFDIVVGLGDLFPHPATGDMVGPLINKHWIASKQTNNVYVEHLYLTNADYDSNDSSQPYFVIELNSAAGTPVDGVIYYRIIDE